MSSAARDLMPRRDRAVHEGTTATWPWRRIPFPSGSAVLRRELRHGATSILVAGEDVA